MGVLFNWVAAVVAGGVVGIASGQLTEDASTAFPRTPSDGPGTLLVRAVSRDLGAPRVSSPAARIRTVLWLAAECDANRRDRAHDREGFDPIRRVVPFAERVRQDRIDRGKRWQRQEAEYRAYAARLATHRDPG